MPTVLLVEYDESLRSYLKVKIEEQGFAVLAVADRIQAIKVIKGIHVDMITLDMKMPGIDGMDFLREVGETSEDISVVMYTDFPGYSTNLAKYRKFRIDAYMQRALDTAKLKKEITGILSGRSLEPSPNRSRSPLVVIPETPAVPRSMLRT